MLDTLTLPIYFKYLMYSGLLALFPWTKVDCQQYISKEEINFDDGEEKRSYLTEYFRAEDGFDTLTFYYRKQDQYADYELSSRGRKKQGDNLYRFWQGDSWNSAESKWELLSKRELFFDADKCEHTYLLNGRFGWDDLDETHTAKIYYEDDCLEPWVDEYSPTISSLEYLDSWTREKVVSGSLTTYIERIEYQFPSTNRRETYRSRQYIAGKLARKETTHTDWGYKERWVYNYHENGDVKREIFSHKDFPDGTWYRNDTTYFEYDYFKEKLFEKRAHHLYINAYSKELYYYDCEGRLIRTEQYWQGELSQVLKYTYQEEAVCPTKEAFNLSIVENPVRDLLTLRTVADLGNADQYVLDITGKLLRSEMERLNQFTYIVDVSNFTAGVYFLVVVCDGVPVTKKFLKV